MERIRRQVVEDSQDEESFATAYATYYVHQQVRYPRYLCYDCHRPNQWSWWDGFDPYYTRVPCSPSGSTGGGPGARSTGSDTFPTTSTSTATIARPAIAPITARTIPRGTDGHGGTICGARISPATESDPPAGYVPPSKFDERSRWRDNGVRPPDSSPVVEFRAPGWIRAPEGRLAPTRERVAAICATGPAPTRATAALRAARRRSARSHVQAQRSLRKPRGAGTRARAGPSRAVVRAYRSRVRAAALRASATRRSVLRVRWSRRAATLADARVDPGIAPELGTTGTTGRTGLWYASRRALDPASITGSSGNFRGGAPAPSMRAPSSGTFWRSPPASMGSRSR